MSETADLRYDAQQQAAGAFTAGPGSMAGALHDQKNARPSLLDRVGGARHRAEHAAVNCARLEELAYLLDSNPAVARILDLIEQTRV